MKRPIFIRPITQEERQQIHVGLRSSDAFVLRRCQILLASQRGERAIAIAGMLRCDEQTVRTVIHGFNATGLEVLREGSSVPHQLHAAFPSEGRETLKALVHRSPREFGFDRCLWTLEKLALVCWKQGLTPKQVTAEAISKQLKCLGLNWKRVKHHINSPDALSLKKTAEWQRRLDSRCSLEAEGGR